MSDRHDRSAVSCFNCAIASDNSSNGRTLINRASACSDPATRSQEVILRFY